MPRPMRPRRRYTHADLLSYLPHLRDRGEAGWKRDIWDAYRLLNQRDQWLLGCVINGDRRITIAATLEVSPATARKMISRARRRLLKKLNRFEDFIARVEEGANEDGTERPDALRQD